MYVCMHVCIHQRHNGKSANTETLLHQSFIIHRHFSDLLIVIHDHIKSVDR